MLFNSLSHNIRRRGLHASAFLFLAAFPGLVFAQDAETPGDRPAAAAPDPEAIPDVRSLGLLTEPKFIGKGIDLATSTFGDGTGERKNGFYVDFSNMITGSGLISAGPGYRHTVFGGKAFFDTSAAASWHFYKMAQGRFEFPSLAGDHLTIGTQARWQDATQVNYFGIGSDAVIAGQSQYRLKTTDVVGYAAVRPTEWFTIGGEFGWLKSPQVSAAAGTFNPNYPDARVLYPTDPGMNAASQPNFLHGEVSLTADNRDYKSHPTGGGLYRAALTTFSDRSTGTDSFRQYEAEAAQFVPLGTKRLILAMHAWTVFSDVLTGNQVPFYMMPVIGGNNTLRAFHDYQFHDLNTVVGSAELRLALLAHIDAAVFYDAGNVAARYTDLNFDKTSVGAGLRLHTDRATFGRLDVAHGSEGWMVVARTTDPFKLSRVSRKTASVPFTP